METQVDVGQEPTQPLVWRGVRNMTVKVQLDAGPAQDQPLLWRGVRSTSSEAPHDGEQDQPLVWRGVRSTTLQMQLDLGEEIEPAADPDAGSDAPVLDPAGGPLVVISIAVREVCEDAEPD